MSYSTAKGYSALIGIVLVAVGLLGFINNPIVGEPGAIFVTGPVHNLVHLVTGAIALYTAFGLTGRAQAQGVLGLGVLYAAVFVLLLVSPTLFGILGSEQYAANLADHVLHAALAVLGIGIGYMAMGREPATM